jgi:hypothetical protein
MAASPSCKPLLSERYPSPLRRECRGGAPGAFRIAPGADLAASDDDQFLYRRLTPESKPLTPG